MGLRLIIVATGDGPAEDVARTLRAEGYDPHWRRAATVAELTAALADGPADLVVVYDRPPGNPCDDAYNRPAAGDPSPGGFADEALRTVRGAAADLPCVVVSDPGAGGAGALLRAGADDHVPADQLYRLVPAVRRELRQARSRRERRSDQEALRRSQEDLRLLADHAQDVIFRCRVEPAFELTYLSPAVTRLTGRAPGELLGDPRRFLDHVAEASERAALERSWRTGQDTARTVGWRRDDGATVWLEQRAEATRTGERAVVVEGILRDVTDRVLAGRERARLRRQRAEAERLESLGRLAGGIAHDFTNALCVIGNSAAFLAEDLPADHPGRADVDRILDATRRSAALTNQLLVFARRAPERAEVVDVVALVVGLDDLIRRTVGEDVELAYEFGAASAPVTIDSGRFEQALVNLAANARAAMPVGGRLRVRTEVVGARVRIEVSDTGLGMTAEVAGQAFEPFFTTRPDAGTGLGLALVHGVVRGAGGEVELASEPGRGTRVTIHLPLAAGAAAAGPVRPPRARGEAVLVVEDDRAVREVVVRVLARDGYRVHAADSAAQALARCARADQPLDLILTDVVLPGPSGVDLAHRLRRLRPGLRVLYLTGYPPERLPAGGPGPAGLIRKPFTPDQLLRQVRTVLDQPAGGEPTGGPGGPVARAGRADRRRPAVPARRLRPAGTRR
jgi:PAS domain S-box-containing protein